MNWLKRKNYKSIDLRLERDMALFVAYKQSLSANTFRTQDDAVDFARKSPAPRFYIDGFFARIVLRRMLNGQPPGVTGKNTLRKFEELLKRYIESEKQNLFPGMNFKAICNILVEQPAPEFYISRRTARAIISAQMKLGWKQILERYKRP